MAPGLLLHIGEAQSEISWQEGVGPRQVQVLTLGSSTLSAAFFKPYPPRALNLENAIAAIEEELFKVRQWARSPVAPWAGLSSADYTVRQIAQVCNAGTWLGTEAVELAFNDLVAMSSGGRSVFGSDAPWVANAASGAVLLILREFLHHMKFDAITVGS